jgi:endonuclease YncB( thermonuclease family)
MAVADGVDSRYRRNMYPYREFDSPRYQYPPRDGPWRHRVSRVLPWVFILGVAAGTMLPVRRWVHWPPGSTWPQNASQDASQKFWPNVIGRRAGDPAVHDVDVIRTIDGDTFEARVHLPGGLEVTTRVRLRDIDAPELKARCEKELRMAQAASDALRNLLAEGGVTISNVGPDKYQGRIDANVATRRTPDVSAALLAGGFARAYDGGHRSGWCGWGWRWR